MKLPNIALTLLFASSVVMAVESTPPPKFTAKPTATKAGDKVKIDFAVERETDVAVFVEDGQGKVVRHLVAGVLGTNAPAPLKPGSLEQSVEWDGKADYGKAAGTGPFKVRVALGLSAKYDKVVVDGLRSFRAIHGMGTGPDGTLYLRVGTGSGLGWGGQQILAFNRDGSYRRMVTPFPANLKMEQVQGLGAFSLGGRPLPLVHSFPSLNLSPIGYGPRKSTMAVTPDGVLLRLVESGAKGLSVVGQGTDGAAPWQPVVGPALPLPVSDRSFVAVSSDGKWAYLSGLNRDAKNPAAAVYRVKLPERTPAEPFFGDPAATGQDEAHLGGAPRGLALDGKGNLLIADFANNRVVLVAEKDGKFAGSFAVKTPDCLGVDAASGAVFVSRLTGKGGVELVRLSGTKDPQEQAKLPLAPEGNPGFPWLMAVDASGKPAVVWMGGDYGKLLRIEAPEGKLGEARDVREGAAGDAAFHDLSVDRLRGEIYARTRGGDGSSYSWLRYSEAEDKASSIRVGPLSSSSGAQLVAGPDGSLYAPSYVSGIFKFDRDGKPSPWAKPRQDPAGKVKTPPHATFVPVSECWTKHVLGARHDGSLFILDPGHNGGRPPKMMREFLPSGELAREEPVIWKVSDGAIGPKFDPAGNIYIAEQIKPADQHYPPEFRELVGPLAVGKSIGGRNVPTPAGNIASMYGSIVKFSPKGGMIHFDMGDQKENPFPGEPKLDPAFKTVEAVSFISSGDQWKLFPVKVTGAEWMHMGYSHVDICHCTCETTRFDVDEFGRVWFPDLNLFQVRVIDTAGNALTKIGGYGNADSCGPESKDKALAQPDIAFAWLVGVAATDKYLYTGDSLNRRMLRSKLVYAAEETCDVK